MILWKKILINDLKILSKGVEDAFDLISAQFSRNNFVSLIRIAGRWLAFQWPIIKLKYYQVSVIHLILAVPKTVYYLRSCLLLCPLTNEINK